MSGVLEALASIQEHVSKGPEITKSVQYAQPTSPMAEHFRRYKEGCFYVEVSRRGSSRSETHGGPFKTKGEAIEYALNLAYPFDRFSMR